MTDGTPCCDWVGSDGAGHYVKMVHNGIEYGDMQVIAEAYSMMQASGMTHEAMAGTFRGWGEGVLDSFLVDITADILAFRDEHGEIVLEKILDAAGQKGTGKWTAMSSLELGQPVTLVAEAVYPRIVSALKDQRIEAAPVLPGPDSSLDELSLDDLASALYCSKIVSYAQGFLLLRAAADEHGWDLDFGRIASLWREGCIIRAAFLDDITAAFDRTPDLTSLLLDGFFTDAIAEHQAGWRRTIARSVGGDPCTGLLVCARLLRRLPKRTSPRQHDPGPAGLLRRPHLRADRPTTGRAFPHRLDWRGRRHHRRFLRRLTAPDRDAAACSHLDDDHRLLQARYGRDNGNSRSASDPKWATRSTPAVYPTDATISANPMSASGSRPDRTRTRRQSFQCHHRTSDRR